MRKFIIVLTCCIGLLLVGYASYRGYLVWKQSHLIVMAKKYAAKLDARNTILCLQQALAMNPRNVDACRMMGTLAEEGRSPAALFWLQRVVELNPKSLPDRLALVQAAIILQNYPLATNTLSGVAEADRKTPLFQNLAGTAALIGGNLAEAEAHFGESARLDPSNMVGALNLAVAQLRSSNALDMAEARIALKRVTITSTNADLVAKARRELIVDAMRSNDKNTALAVSEELVGQTNGPFADQILRLNVLLSTKSSSFGPTLALDRRSAATDPSKLADLAKWQMVNLSPGETLLWLQSLPTGVQTNQPVPVLIAECLIMTHNWSALQKTLESQNWGPLDFSRHAFLAYSLRERGLEGAFNGEWTLAVSTASPERATSPVFDANLKWLLVNAAAWKWRTEEEQILWTIFNKFPEDQSVAGPLAQILMISGRTQSLMELFGIQARRNPSDLNVKNNLAMVTMLLNAEQSKSYDLARAVYEKAPTNPSFASTYAFSLHLRGKDADALKVLQQLKPQDLQDPHIAGYYGIALKGAGDRSKAKTYLALAMKTRLLPEEQKMFQQALGGL